MCIKCINGKESELKRIAVIRNISMPTFGFDVRSQTRSEGGPLPEVSAVLAGGAAEKAGLCRGDRIISVDDVSVEWSTHKRVMDIINARDECLILISMFKCFSIWCN